MSTSRITDSDGSVLITTSADGDHVVSTTPASPATPTTPPTPATPGGHFTSTGDFTVGIHSDKPFDGASFVVGLLVGVLLVFVINRLRRRHARREARGMAHAAAIGPQPEDRMAAEVAALSRRTATLETIVTDPAQRTAREIEALR